jgi:hypothetical protein
MPIRGKEIREALHRSDERLKNASPEEILNLLRRIDPDLDTRQPPKVSVRKTKIQHKKSKHATA